MIIRLRKNIVDRLKEFFHQKDQIIFIEKLSKLLNKDIKVVDIDNENYLLTIESLDSNVVDTIKFDTHCPSSNMFRIAEKDIRAFDIVEMII